MKNACYLLFVVLFFATACEPDPIDPPINNINGGATDSEKLVATWKTSTIYDSSTSPHERLFDDVEDAHLLVITFSDTNSIEVIGDGTSATGSYSASSNIVNIIAIDMETLPASYPQTEIDEHFFNFVRSADEFYFDGSTLVLEKSGEFRAEFVKQ